MKFGVDLRLMDLGFLDFNEVGKVGSLRVKHSK